MFQGHPKGSLDFSDISETPGGRMEHSLRSIPNIYPQLSISSETTSSDRYLLPQLPVLYDTIFDTVIHSPGEHAKDGILSH